MARGREREVSLPRPGFDQGFQKFTIDMDNRKWWR